MGRGENIYFNFSIMKTLIAIIALTFSIQTFASVECSFIQTNSTRQEVTTSVPLSSFGFDSWKYAVTKKVTLPVYIRVCREVYAPHMGTPYAKYPSVPLAEFNMDSWTYAK